MAATAQPAADKTTRITICKCPCGDPVCTTYGLSDGRFHQGTGWSKERAQQYADAVNQSAAVDAVIKAAQTTVCGFCGWVIGSQDLTASPCESCLPLRAALKTFDFVLTRRDVNRCLVQLRATHLAPQPAQPREVWEAAIRVAAGSWLVQSDGVATQDAIVEALAEAARDATPT